MKVQKMVVNHFSPKNLKAMTINVIGVTGLIIATLAILFAQDQTALLNQIGHELTRSPLGTVLTTVKAFF